MSHYGYVSEQLLNGGVFPPPRNRDRRRKRQRRREPLTGSQPGAVEPTVEVTPVPRGSRTGGRRKVGALAHVVHGRR